MDSYPEREEHESRVKRLKLDSVVASEGAPGQDVVCTIVSTSSGARIDPTEGAAQVDCDSGYEASSSTNEGACTPLFQSPPHYVPDAPEGFCNYSQTSPNTQTDNQDTSQDSMLEGDDDNVSTVSHISDISGLSELSGQDWKPTVGSMAYIRKQMQKGADPRSTLVELGVEMSNIPQFVDDIALWKLIINMLGEPPVRHKLRHVNTLDDVVRLLKGAQNIIVLTGAGVSVSCGIPDFRSRDGIYSRLAIDFPDLPDPQAMFDISYFSQDPRPFFKFAKDIYPGKFQPSPCHRFIKLLEKQGKLLRNYTQNIDTLEKVAEIDKVIECHGSFATATCTKCSRQVTADQIRDVVLNQNIPVCVECQPDIGPSISMESLKDREPGALRDLVSAGIMKPDIVFFGEGLPDSFHEAMVQDKTKCDLLLVIGSSLKVRPVALIPSSLPSSVPQILINREILGQCVFDVELLGDCDVIINHLCQLMGPSWESGIYKQEMLKETLHLLPWELDSTSDILLKELETSAKESESAITCKCQPEPNTDTCSSSTTEKTPCKCTNNLLKPNQDSYSPRTSTDTIEDDTYDPANSAGNVGTVNSSTEERTNPSAVNDRLESPRPLGNENYSPSAINSEFYTPPASNAPLVDSTRSCSPDSSLSPAKQRHMSIDSARDSGIGDNSNFTDVDTAKFELPEEPCSSTANINPTITTDLVTPADKSIDLRGFWLPKQKCSLADRLPENSFYLIQPSRYIFPGAEYFIDPDEKYNYFDNTSSESCDSESEEPEPVENSF